MMNGSVLLCVFLIVGSTSAWHFWGFQSKNRYTECGMYNSRVRGEWEIGFTKTDFDTVALLKLLKERLDVNKDNLLTANEVNNLQVYKDLDSTLTFDTGVLRCNYVAFIKKFLGVDQEVANTVFTMTDANGDERLTFSDSNNFMANDKNGDGKVTICEMFQGYVSVFAEAENRVYTKEMKVDKLIKKYSKNNGMIWDFFNWW